MPIALIVGIFTHYGWQLEPRRRAPSKIGTHLVRGVPLVLSEHLDSLAQNILYIKRLD